MDNLRRDFERWVRQTHGRSPRGGEFLESYVTYMYQSLLVRHAQNVRVTNGANVPDKRGNTYAIDVFFEFEIAGVQHRVAIECKDHKRPISRDEVIAFHGKISDMPSTIGVFVSLSGFQQGAKRYLDDHGVEHFDGSSLPQFGSIIASWFQPMALPDVSAVGQPFWTVMEARDGHPTGSWLLIPVQTTTRTGRTKQVRALPLFWSKKEAGRFQTHWADVDDSPSCVRGLTQPALRAFGGIAEQEGLQFATMTPRIEQRPLYDVELWEPQDLAAEFISVPEKPDRRPG